jgi:N6-adenosine-specific RNA methylase IME4
MDTVSNTNSTSAPMMTALATYDAARKALAEAHRVDDVKSIRDKAVAMQEYARQAKDGDMIAWATDIRLRAERRAGQLLAEMKASGEREAGGRPEKRFHGERVKLADLGVSEIQSHRWQKLAALDEDAFEERATVAKRQAVASVEATAAERASEKKERRQERETELGARLVALPDKRYGVIYADPAWKFEPYSRETGMDRAADNHYPTSALEQICALDVPSIAAPDCALFLWSTAPMQREAFMVMDAWGFEYRSQFVWIKDRIGTGYWTRNKHEILLIGARGDIPAPAPGTQFPSAIEAPVGEHSAKPDAFAELIEAYFPTLPKIELNRRGPARPNWDAWGLEAA